jgi:hypothetical protein
MKEPEELKEIHEIMENIYKEEKGLSMEERIKRLREDSDRFMLERNLRLTRVKPKERRKVEA